MKAFLKVILGIATGVAISLLTIAAIKYRAERNFQLQAQGAIAQYRGEFIVVPLPDGSYAVVKARK